ncbi:WD repeat and FYVE domain-containing protein 1 isoform X2 [Prionailurus iriomotensis]
MAAEIHSRPQSSRPVLLSKIEGHQDAVTAALLIPKEDGVITASEDRTIRVWLKRDSGQYWPSIYHTMASPCSAMAYHHDSRRIFVGQDNGAVMPPACWIDIFDTTLEQEFHVSEDFNKMNFIKTYPAHQNRVSAIIFSMAAEWVISTGHDKCVSWMCTRSGNMLGRHFFTSWASCLQYDYDTQYAFVGDYSGQITLLKLEQNSCSVITTLKGHEGSIACLWWDPIQRLLFSGASDNSIIMWDIGGRKGRTLLLQGHHDRVQSLCYLQLTRQLVSCSSDGGIAVWNMDVSREEHFTATMLSMSSCLQEACNLLKETDYPRSSVVRERFLSEMRAALFLEHKTDVGHKDTGVETDWQVSGGNKCVVTDGGDNPSFYRKREDINFHLMNGERKAHHCRKCGQAVCGKCSSKRSSYPVMGFEFQVRVCDSCYDSIKDEDRTSLATFHEGKHNITHMSMDVARGLMVTCGTDRIVKNLGHDACGGLQSGNWVFSVLIREPGEACTFPEAPFTKCSRSPWRHRPRHGNGQ